MLEIGNNIRRIREIKNYTQEAVAEKVGMSDVNFTRLGEIAKALEVKPEEIVNFGSTTYNTTNNLQDSSGLNSSFGSGPITNNITIDKDVFDKIIKDKDEEIAFLREQLRKG
jgi:transcriptional regulator with XRE-family HTH domain